MSLMPNWPAARVPSTRAVYASCVIFAMSARGWPKSVFPPPQVIDRIHRFVGL